MKFTNKNTGFWGTLIAAIIFGLVRFLPVGLRNISPLFAFIAILAVAINSIKKKEELWRIVVFSILTGCLGLYSIVCIQHIYFEADSLMPLFTILGYICFIILMIIASIINYKKKNTVGVLACGILLIFLIILFMLIISKMYF